MNETQADRRFVFRDRKGILSLTEHLITILLIIVVVVGMMVLFSAYQANRFALERQKTLSSNALGVATALLGAPALTKEHALFDDVELTAAKLHEGEVCAMLERQLGYPWFMVLEVPGSVTECDSSYSSGCGRWSFCAQAGRNVSYLFPANVFRTVVAGYQNGRVDFALVRVGVYQ